MFVIVVYDVDEKRCNKILKTCRKYLEHVQNSVLEGNITQKNLTSLKNDIKRIVDPSHDNICIYEFDSLRYSKRILLGVKNEREIIL